MTLSPDLINLLTLVVAYLVAVAVLPTAIRVAPRVGALDRPDGSERRRQAIAIPRLGGVAVVLAVNIAALPVVLLVEQGNLFRIQMGEGFLRFFLALGLILALGVWDDVLGLPPRVKLFIQVVAAALVIAGGFSIDRVTFLPGWPVLDLGVLAPVVTLLWIVGITNAMNLIDGLDGLASATSLVALGGIITLVSLSNYDVVFPYVMALTGALLAFLRHNRHPARIYLGDAGSLSLGFFLSVRAIWAATDDTGVTAVAVPLALFAYPLFDTTMTMARRWLRGDRIMTADGRHVHHRIVAIGLPVPRAVWGLVLLQALLVSVAVLAAVGPQMVVRSLALPVLLSLGFLALAAARWLGYREFVALTLSVRSVLRRALSTVRYKIHVAELAAAIERAPTPDALRDQLRNLVDGTHIVGLELSWGSTCHICLLDDMPSPSSLISHQQRFEVTGVERKAAALTVRWWSSREGLRHHRADQIFIILGPALQRWLVQHAEIPHLPKERNTRARNSVALQPRLRSAAWHE